MKSLKVVLAAVFGFMLGAALFHTPPVKGQGAAKIVEMTMRDLKRAGQISGPPIGISCLPEGQQGTVCYVLTQ